MIKELEQLHRFMSNGLPEGHVHATNELDGAFRAVEPIFEGWENPPARFLQADDLRTIVMAAMGLNREGGTTEGKDLGPLREDLRMIDEQMTRGSGAETLREYAYQGSLPTREPEGRRNQSETLMNVLSGTFLPEPPRSNVAAMFEDVLAHARADDGSLVPGGIACAACGEEIGSVPGDARIAWRKDETVSQMHNACFVHAEGCSQGATGFRFASPLVARYAWRQQA